MNLNEKRVKLDASLLYIFFIFYLSKLHLVPEPVILLKGGFFFVPPVSVKWVVPDSVVDAFNITCREGTASPASISVNSSDIGQTSKAYCTDLPLTGVHHWMSVVAISNGKQSDVSTAQVSCKLKFINIFFYY